MAAEAKLAASSPLSSPWLINDLDTAATAGRTEMMNRSQSRQKLIAFSTVNGCPVTTAGSMRPRSFSRAGVVRAGQTRPGLRMPTHDFESVIHRADQQLNNPDVSEFLLARAERRYNATGVGQ